MRSLYLTLTAALALAGCSWGPPPPTRAEMEAEREAAAVDACAPMWKYGDYEFDRCKVQWKADQQRAATMMGAAAMGGGRASGPTGFSCSRIGGVNNCYGY